MLRIEEDIKADLEAETAPDPEFFSAILRRMILHKAKARLRELHSILVSRGKSRQINETNVPKAMGWREEVTLLPQRFHSPTSLGKDDSCLFLRDRAWRGNPLLFLLQPLGELALAADEAKKAANYIFWCFHKVQGDIKHHK